MKKVIRIAKLIFPGGEAKPGPGLASTGVNIMSFCNAFNGATQEKKGEQVPVLLTVYNDKTFDFQIKTPPTANLIKKNLKIDKGEANSKKPVKKLSLTNAQIEDIAKIKLPDLNTDDIEAAKKIVIGTMKQMGVSVAKKE